MEKYESAKIFIGMSHRCGSGRKRRGETNERIYQERTDMNLVCLMSGGMPAAKNEIAIDRMYADNNKLKVGDKLKIAGEELTVTGLVALPDTVVYFPITAI